ncbi:DUF2723 domain-containing protein [Flavihumibacter sp. R14]|nr:DUF2723 domain-containing protein [Flavihumibacter soli]
MEKYNRINILFGWLSFALAFTVYMLTLQPSGSFWDCGEFIATAYGIQVGHQPGAPLFMMLGRLFSFLAGDSGEVAFWVNSLSALASALTVMFLFWTITALGRKLVAAEKDSTRKLVTVMGAGLTGALAYAFTDSFWFSAVEAEVYSFSSLCTAIVFWGALKWEASSGPAANRWLVFIAYMIGLSIGIHLLSLLAIPGIVLLWYFKQNKSANKKGAFLALLAGCLILGFVQVGIVQYLLLFAFKTDLLFVNSLNMSFGSGVLFFGLVLVAAIGFGIRYSHRRKKPVLNLALVCVSFIILGYSSYAMILIRAGAKTSINISNPDNAYSLLRYVSRGQYSQAPLLYGQYFDSETTGVAQGKMTYREDKGKYAEAGPDRKYQYDRNTLFPRIYSDEASDVAFYRNWLGLDESSRPDFKDNLQFFSSYQLGFMYMRYLMWNFAGRQDDEQGQGSNVNGNWISGVKPLDQLRLGAHAEVSPLGQQNEGYNRFYGLPFVLGICGLIFHFRRRSKDALVLAVFFFFTGLGIVLYLNQDPLQVRERDYAYVGSFYVFAIWLGLGVLAVQHWLSGIAKARTASILAILICFAAAPFLMIREGWNDHDRSENRVAREMAVNYLESCAPNAILFTNADNDTYPLWYAQEVEGIRPDVRIVNLQLLFDPDYVTALKKKINNSDPLPVTMSAEKYKAGVRDVIYYMDYGLSDSVELKDLFELLVSDHESDKVPMNDGSKVNFLPSKKFRMSVNREELLKTGTLSKEEIVNAEDSMQWTYPRNYMTRSDLALMDILAHNNWKRPIYFTFGVSDDSYFGLDRYLHLEGFTYRLLPLRRDAEDKRDKSEVTHSRVFYSNLKNKFLLDSFNKAAYLDPESRRVARQTWNLLNTLAADLGAEGRTAEAKDVISRAVENLPMRNYTIRDSVEKYRAAVTLYRLNEPAEANRIAASTVQFLAAELRFLGSLDKEKQESRMDEISLAASVLNGFREEAGKFKQLAVVSEVDGIFAEIEKSR